MKYNKSYYLIIISLLLSFGYSFNACAFKIRYTWHENNKYVYLTDVAEYYGMKLNVNKSYCELTSRYSRIRFCYKSRDVNLNGTKVIFFMSPIYNKGTPAISEKDFLLQLDPILRKNALTKHRLTTVVIDPGHGGHDSGAIGKRYKEKDIALLIALKLKNILQANGFKVVLTRDKNIFLPLKSRPEVCTGADGDIFVSIHCNSVRGDKSITGVETFIYTPVGTTSTYGGRIVSKAEDGNIYDKNNSRLGYEIQSNLIRSKKYAKIDRGVKHAQFAVLKYCPVPAALVEVGFMSNPEEERLLGLYSYQYETALSIAKGIISYRNAMLAGKG